MMQKIMYSASFSYGEPSLIKITISKETEKTISVSDKQILLGESYSQHFGYKRVFKDSLHLFNTLTECIEYLIEQLKEANENHQKEIEDNNQSMYRLELMNND